MNYLDQVSLGQSTIRVTRLGLGSAPLGKPGVADVTAIGIIRRALEMGITLIDTAPLYGLGSSEQRIGRALHGVSRESFVLGTKVGRLLVPCEDRSSAELRVVFDFSYDGVMRSFDSSLRRLRVDSVDIVHIHDPDDYYEEAAKGAYPAICELRRQGIVRALSAGMNQAAMLTRFAKQFDFDCFLLAGRYTLIDHAGLKELLPLCLNKKVSIIIGGPFNSGILASGAKPGAQYDYAEAPRAIFDRVRKIENICRVFEVPLRAAALQFPLAHPAVAAVIPGPRTILEFEQNAQTMTYPICAEFWSELRHEGLLPEEAPVPV